MPAFASSRSKRSRSLPAAMTCGGYSIPARNNFDIRSSVVVFEASLPVQLRRGEVVLFDLEMECFDRKLPARFVHGLERSPTETAAAIGRRDEELVHESIPPAILETPAERENEVADGSVAVAVDPRSTERGIGEKRLEGPASLLAIERIALSGVELLHQVEHGLAVAGPRELDIDRHFTLATSAHTPACEERSAAPAGSRIGFPEEILLSKDEIEPVDREEEPTRSIGRDGFDPKGTLVSLRRIEGNQPERSRYRKQMVLDRNGTDRRRVLLEPESEGRSIRQPLSFLAPALHVVELDREARRRQELAAHSLGERDPTTIRKPGGERFGFRTGITDEYRCPAEGGWSARQHLEGGHHPSSGKARFPARDKPSFPKSLLRERPPPPEARDRARETAPGDRESPGAGDSPSGVAPPAQSTSMSSSFAVSLRASRKGPPSSPGRNGGIRLSRSDSLIAFAHGTASW